LVTSKKSFILDSSVDRRYKEIKEGLEQNGYDMFLISIDISKEYLLRLYEAKGYVQTMDEVDRFINDHKNFLVEYEKEVDVKIDDSNFLNRLDICLKAIEDYMESK
jgi:nicotinamide riboside kinase